MPALRSAFSLLKNNLVICTINSVKIVDAHKMRSIFSLAVVVVALCSSVTLAVDCESVTSESACTSNASCAWCTSGAVGSSCMDATDAAGLPSSVFSCTFGSGIKEAAPHTHSTAALSGGLGKDFDLNAVPTSDRAFSIKNQDKFLNASTNALGANLVGANAQSYPNDPFGYSSLYFSEIAYCADAPYPSFMDRDYTTTPFVTDFVPTYYIQYGPSASTRGFIGYQPSINAIIVSYRGSSDIENWFTNLNFIFTSYPNCNNCKVHEGFYEAEQSVIDDVMQEVSRLNGLYPDYSIVVTGHSLGAALATLTALDLVGTFGSLVNIYNYGCPRMFNQAAANWASSGVVNIGARRTHYKDIVPHSPPEFMDFVHTSGEIYEQGTPSTYPTFPGAPLQDCSGEEDPNCADQWDWTSIDDHLLYSGVVMGSGGCSAL